MNSRERFKAVMNFQKVDRLPVMEWISWWDKTVDRWKTEGLPAELGREDTLKWFGLDVNEWIWLHPRRKIPRIPGKARSDGLITSENEYETLVLPFLQEPVIDAERLKRIAASQARGACVVWLQFDGFFWFPREIFGVENHLYAFFDHPGLMRRMNEDLCRYNLNCLEQVLKILTPDVLTFAEDLSYNHGPMMSREQFFEFVAPFYAKLVPAARKAGILQMVDTDGDVSGVIPWFEETGVQGCLPLERMAGVDVNKIRKEHPKWRMIGGFDKTLIRLGEPAVRAEFERLLPAMKSGGYIPTADHQTPPDVSLEAYKTYVSLLKEYSSLV